jgi:cysteine desulfurase
MAANNETGVVVPLSEIVKLVRERAPQAVIHTDAAQLLGKEHVSFQDLGVDLMTVSAHKIGALSGVGAVLIRDGVQLRPLIVGGAQEEKLRGGTENVLGIVVFGAVLEQVEKDLSNRITTMSRSRDTFEAFVCKELPDCIINGASLARLPNTSSVYVPGVRADDLVVALDLAGILASTGAACSSGKREPSHVLLAMGQTPQRASSTVRISMRADSSPEQVQRVCDVFKSCVARIRAVRHEKIGVAREFREASMTAPLESNS